MNRTLNFSAGPAILPEPVLKEAAAGVLEINGRGMSVLEVSHRGKDYEQIHFGAQERLLSLLGLTAEDYAVMFIQGGASTQFAMLPINFLGDGRTADYINAGEWGSKAIAEAMNVGKGTVREAASSADGKFSYIPKDFRVTPGAAYLHITTNNTIEGTQWFDMPTSTQVPLTADMSSDFLALERDYASYSLFYAGAQKNAGPAGVTVVIGRKSFLEQANKGLPSMLSYKTFWTKDSLYNTPPCFAIYVVGLVAKWVQEQGGLKGMEKINREKAALLYSALDECGSFYQAAVTAKEDRSLMNVTFRMQPRYAELEKEFLNQAQAQGMDGLKGHRAVGGFRASIYNAFPTEGVKVLADFMRAFSAANG
jgi:phosphoserine aminotransferase